MQWHKVTITVYHLEYNSHKTVVQEKLMRSFFFLKCLILTHGDKKVSDYIFA